MRRGWLSILFGVLLAPTMMPPAAGAVPGNGFVLSPAFQDVSVRDPAERVPFELSIVNRNRQDQTFRLSAADFGTLDEQGGVAFLGTPVTELEHKYGLASWLVLGANQVMVRAGETAKVTVTITNRPSLAPGGHYGAVLATAVDEQGRPMDDRVGVQPVLSSLVLVVKEGGEERELKLANQTSDAAFWRLPSQIEQRYQNSGNVHVVPRGVVEVRDPWNRVVARNAINDGSTVILPESFRRYKTPLLNVDKAWLPGYYRLVSTYRYDGSDQTKTLVSGFWYAGAVVVWVVSALALGAIGSLAWWLWWRPRGRHKESAK